ncbi:hypothetical protein ELH49_09290 [Rhizobium ruizarguesonis]|uniref:hypothetical protein n=1 Tax=Rhizobium ruizarguesonis TaxID=2081791 RepID=UPI001030C25E|nr:hypothetical protein [Rhizobium ruizarguesonis]TBB44212.1 hypothetical protein ELH49_09290 [Rhizobium ruizarguesonis]
MSDVSDQATPTTKPNEFSEQVADGRSRLYFLAGGLIFLLAALILFGAAAYFSFVATNNGRDILNFTIQRPDDQIRPPDDQQFFKFLPVLIGIFASPIICLICAFTCSILGVRLLNSSGAVATHVIAPQDYPLLGPAIAAGNADAIGQFIRLSSLSGATGTFTKIGLTGLPLATIVLTLILALLGIFNDQFFDLAKLTLGAFLGSFVQRQAESVGPTKQ